jgi:hypothetical protein
MELLTEIAMESPTLSQYEIERGKPMRHYLESKSNILLKVPKMWLINSNHIFILELNLVWWLLLSFALFWYMIIFLIMPFSQQRNSKSCSNKHRNSSTKVF